MKQFLPFLLLLFFVSSASAQNIPLGFTKEETKMLDWYDFHNFSEKGITTPPNIPVRTMAEWEEIAAICITWTQFKSILAQIILYAKEEVEVILICESASLAQSQLLNIYDLPNLDNITFLERDYNKIWMRDYGPNTVYYNDVDSLAIVDWIYNRVRPDDDVIPDGIGELLNIPVFSTILEPTDVVNVGGNFTSDGLGTGFSSKLILTENGPENIYDVTPKDEVQIDAIMEEWMGIDRYIKMDELPYDGIHHIDMHMKLLDEETILVGEYPAGQADGPQIEENINYILEYFQSPFGTPYKIERIQMPPENGIYPDNGAAYRTYTNSVFVNKTILVPIYQEEQFDTTALCIYRENMPGYNVVGIDCNSIIQLSGALHCITRSIGVADPLWIVHQELCNQIDNFSDHEVKAMIKHRSGITTANLYWKTDLDAEYESIPMTLTDSEIDEWTGFIPNQGMDAEKIYYYIEGTSNSGKTQVRPLPAPEGYFEFETNFATSTENFTSPTRTIFSPISPNPVHTTASFSIDLPQQIQLKIDIMDVLGKRVKMIYDEDIDAGKHPFFIDAKALPSGLYFVRMSTGQEEIVQRMVIR